MTEPVAFYLPEPDGTFRSTTATTSPWDPTQQHGGPPSALLARAIELCSPRPDMAVCRVSVDFLGGIPQGVMTVEAEVIRPGRRVELVEARLSTAGRTAVVARAWRMRVSPGSAPAMPEQAVQPPELPDPQPQRYFASVAPDWGYGRAIEWRFVGGHYTELGPARVWARPRLPLVHGETTSGLQRALIIADSANGLSSVLSLDEWLFVPPTLSLTLYREPVGDWILVDAETVIDSRGTGMAQAAVSDRDGAFGVATQPLLVQRRAD